MRTWYPDCGLAFAARSGTPLPGCPSSPTGTLAPDCQPGRGEKLLTPPPVAPPSMSFHTTSERSLFPDAVMRVPPQVSTHGLEAGKTTCACPSPTPSVTPLSPAAVRTVMFLSAAARNTSSIRVIASLVQLLSVAPQVTTSTDGAFPSSATAEEIASTKPWSVLGAK